MKLVAHARLKISWAVMPVSVRLRPALLKNNSMSIYATNYIVEEETGEQILLKHLNKERVDRKTARGSGSNKKRWNKGKKKKEYQELKRVQDIDMD